MISEIISYLQETFSSFLSQTISFLPKLILAIVVFTIFYFISIFVKKGVRKLLQKYVSNKTLVSLLSTTIKISIIILGLILALGILELSKTVTSILTGVGILGIVVGFAFQDIAANFFAGVVLSFQKPLQIGDVIEVEDIFGTIDQIHLRSTNVITFQGQYVQIPNRILFENPLINYTRSKKRRVDLEVGVSYTDDLEKVKEVTLNAMKKVKEILPNEEIKFFYTKFDSSSINFSLRFWVNYSNEKDYLLGRSNAIIEIKKAFDKENITIPFPIRTLEFSNRLGVKNEK